MGQNELDLINRLISRIASTEIIYHKTEDEACTFYAKGRKALNSKMYEDAIVAFTHGLIRIPKDSIKIAEYYIGRSIALQKSKAFVESIQDIEEALQFTIFDEKLKEDLLTRKKIMESLYLKSKLKDNSKEEITLSYGENREMKGVSKAITLKYNEKFGQHYVAEQDIQMGDVLMIQKPFVSIPTIGVSRLLVEKKWICDYCLDDTVAPIPCANCIFCVYCSPKCQSNAYKKYHKIECKILKYIPFDKTKTALYLRAVLIATEQGEKFHDFVTTWEKMENALDRREVGFKDGKFDGCCPDAVLSSFTNADRIKFHGAKYDAAIVYEIIKEHTDFLQGNNLDDDQLDRFFTLMSYVCYKHTYTIRRNHPDNLIAFALCPAFNLLNEACDCNTLTYDDENKNKILRACKDIKRGEQIYISYRPELTYLTIAIKEKMRIFRENNLFNCECDWCEKEDYYNQRQLKKTFTGSCPLETELREKPYDTDILWTFLKMLLSQDPRPYLGIEIIQYGLINAYSGEKNEDLPDMLEKIGLFKKKKN